MERNPENTGLLAAAEEIFEYLRLRNAPPAGPPDLIVGFGHFDLKIPRRCAELWTRFKSPVLFTGGRGSGTADLDLPEADAFEAEFRSLCPSIPEELLLVENRSTNTSENIAFGLEILRARRIISTPDGLPRSAAIVASPYRQRRVYLACLRHLPGTTFYNLPPDTTFAEEESLFASKGQDLVGLLTGEVRRLVIYPAKGYIHREEVPGRILDLCARIEAQSATGGPDEQNL